MMVILVSVKAALKKNAILLGECAVGLFWAVSGHHNCRAFLSWAKHKPQQFFIFSVFSQDASKFCNLPIF